MTVVETNTSDVQKTKMLGVRHVQVIMIFLGFALSLWARTTMSLAIVDMTNPNNENHFDWTLQRQSIILSAFSWGYIILQSGSGELASKYGGMTLLVICIVVNSLVSLVIPIAAIYGGWIMVCICRGIQGLAQGTLYPTVHYLISKWVPINERGRMTSFIYSGSPFGTSFQLVVSGYLASYWGWTSIFYAQGIVGLIWTVGYLLVGSDNPQVSKLISAEERFHIQSSLGQIGGHKRLKTPWKSILTSLPFYAGLIANVGVSWGYWTLLTETPTYMAKFLQVDIKSNGILSSLPYLTTFVVNFPVGFMSDYITQKKWVSLTTCRKIFNSMALFGPAICLLGLTYVPVGNITLAVTLLCITSGFSSGCYGGYMIIFLDMAQNFAGTLHAISNFSANVAGLFAPLYAGFVLKDETNQMEWRIIFYTSTVVYAVSNIMFLLFATSDEQEWNKGVEISKTKIKT